MVQSSSNQNPSPQQLSQNRDNFICYSTAGHRKTKIDLDEIKKKYFETFPLYRATIFITTSSLRYSTTCSAFKQGEAVAVLDLIHNHYSVSIRNLPTNTKTCYWTSMKNFLEIYSSAVIVSHRVKYSSRDSFVCHCPFVHLKRMSSISPNP